MLQTKIKDFVAFSEECLKNIIKSYELKIKRAMMKNEENPAQNIKKF